MQNLAKKQWNPNISVKDAVDLGIEFSVRARQKNVIATLPPKLYFCYVAQDCPDLTYFHNISALFRFSQKDTPYIDQTRDRVLRMLSVATKAHFFLFHKEKVAHEPYYFAVPDLSNPSNTYYGLIYKIASQDKTIMVCERQLKNTALQKLEKSVSATNPNHVFIKAEPIINVLYEFPTVVPEDSFKWFHYKKWYALQSEAQQAFGPQDMVKAVGQKSVIFNELKAIKKMEDLERKCHILTIPYELKDFMMEAGCLWHPGLKVWYLPRGHDLEVVLHYLNYLKYSIK